MLMNIFEGVEPVGLLKDGPWVILKMMLIFIVFPIVAVGLLGRYLLRLRGQVVNFLMGLGALVGLYFLASNIDEIYEFLK